MNIKPILNELNSCAYCIIKANDNLPEYQIGEDIDIFCYNLDETIRTITAVNNKETNSSVYLNITRLEHHAYVDFCEESDDKIIIRFDLYSSLPTYNNVSIKPAFFECIVENRLKKKFNDIDIFVPSKIDELILRYIEYHEWYSIRPDKIKHIDFILDNTSSEEKREMITKLHHYISIPIVETKYPIQKASRLRLFSARVKRFVKQVLMKVFKK